MFNPTSEEDDSIGDGVTAMTIEGDYPLTFTAQRIIEAFVRIQMEYPLMLELDLG